MPLAAITGAVLCLAMALAAALTYLIVDTRWLRKFDELNDGAHAALDRAEHSAKCGTCSLEIAAGSRALVVADGPQRRDRRWNPVALRCDKCVRRTRSIERANAKSVAAAKRKVRGAA